MITLLLILACVAVFVAMAGVVSVYLGNGDFFGWILIGEPCLKVLGAILAGLIEMIGDSSN